MKFKNILQKTIFSSLLIITVSCSSATTNDTASTNSSNTNEQTTTQENTASEEKVKISYWHHDGAAKTNPIYEGIISEFMAENPDVEVEYLGLPADSFFQKYLTAIATNTGPDVYGTRLGELSSMVAQNALEPFDDYLNTWENYEDLEPTLINTIKKAVPDEKIYMLPQYYNHDVHWYNTKLFEEKGITAPNTVNEFMEYCENFADPNNGKYFYTLRGVGGYPNTLSFIITDADILGVDKTFFNEDGTAIFRDPKFVTALDKYVSIYKNSWCSKDSITAGYKEMVAEFGAGISMYIFHNSSSVVEHGVNLGEGNFMNAAPPANDISGNKYIMASGANGVSVSSATENMDAAMRLATYFAESSAVSNISENIGKIPANKIVYEEDWFTSNPYMSLYSELMADNSVIYYDTPAYLPEWKEFQTMISDDLQAIMLDKDTSENVLIKWSDNLEQWEATYQEAN